MNVVRLDGRRRHPAGTPHSTPRRQDVAVAPRRMSPRQRARARQWRTATILCWTATCIAVGARHGLWLPAFVSTVFAASRWWAEARVLGRELRIPQRQILWSGLVGGELRIVLREDAS